jgi:hypothetical protein
MPYSFVIDNNAEVIRETWIGTFDLDELIESCHVEWAHPDYRSGLKMLSDFRNARGELTADDVLKFASWFSNDEAPVRHAIVVRRERAFDFANMFSMIRESVETQVVQARPAPQQAAESVARASQTRLFFSYAEADAWIVEGS